MALAGIEIAPAIIIEAARITGSIQARSSSDVIREMIKRPRLNRGL